MRPPASGERPVRVAGLRTRAATLAWIAMVALACVAAGRLGAWVAAHPGYATAIAPASGIALAAVLLLGTRVLPGVLLGAITVQWLHTGLSAAGDALLALALGGAATAQAGLGARLARRAGFDHIFSGEFEVIRTLLLGGPVACVLGASLGTIAVWLSGRLPASDLPFHWLSTWVGDSLGVLIFAPLICAWAQRPFTRWRRQQVALSLPVAVVATAAVMLFVYVRDAEQRRRDGEFQMRARHFADSLQTAVNANIQMLVGLRSFHTAFHDVRRQESETFVLAMLPNYPAVQMVGWSQPVAAEDRAAFELAVQIGGAPGYRILEPGPAGGLVPAGDRPRYLATSQIVPTGRDGLVLGLDLLSEPLRRAAVERALRNDRVAASPWLYPLETPERHPSTILYMPLLPADGDAPRLVAAALVRIQPLLDAAFAGLKGSGMQVSLHDDGADAPIPAIHVGDPPHRSSAGPPQPGYRLKIRVADRSWTASFTLPAQGLATDRSWLAWGMLAVGLSLAALLGMLLLVLLARQARIEDAVRRRTAELGDAQQKLVGYAADLERSNKELAQFASVASHDLQAPVRGVISFVQLLRDRYAGRVLDARGEEFLRLIEQSATHMKALIDGLLTLSRVGHAHEDHGVTDCGQVLAEVEAQLAAMVQERDALITHDRLPRVRGSRIEIFQLLQNLIVNGLKFQPGPGPRIHVGAVREGNMWRLSVRDHGIGIAARHQERIFRIFQRLHTTAYEGTGIGLALCEKIVTGHGGRIWVDSAPGQGATFHFTLPAADDD